MLAKMLAFMGGFWVWAQVWCKGSCVGKVFWAKNHNLILTNFMEQILFLDYGVNRFFSLIKKFSKLHIGELWRVEKGIVALICSIDYCYNNNLLDNLVVLYTKKVYNTYTFFHSIFDKSSDSNLSVLNIHTPYLNSISQRSMLCQVCRFR